MFHLPRNLAFYSNGALIRNTLPHGYSTLGPCTTVASSLRTPGFSLMRLQGSTNQSLMHSRLSGSFDPCLGRRVGAPHRPRRSLRLRSAPPVVPRAAPGQPAEPAKIFPMTALESIDSVMDMTWIESEFAALRYFALAGTDHRRHTE